MNKPQKTAQIKFRTFEALAKKFRVKLARKGQTAQEVLEQAVIEYLSH